MYKKKRGNLYVIIYENIINKLRLIEEIEDNLSNQYNK